MLKGTQELQFGAAEDGKGPYGGIGENLKNHLFGAIFARDSLDWQSRELASVGALAAVPGVEIAIAARCRRAPSAARVARRQGLARGGGPVPGGPPGGGRFEGTGNWQAFAIRDGQLITGQNPQSSHLVARELRKAMRTADAQDGRHPWSTVRRTASG